MRYGIISDIHANLEALQTALTDINVLNVDQVVCLGDIVGYGANPNECLDIIRDKCEIVILGNHDNVAIGREEPENYNQYALHSIEWTKNNLTQDNKKFIQSLPYMFEENNILFVHASPKSPADWAYVTSLDDAVDSFDFFSQEVCFIGHTHCPVIIIKENDQNFQVIEDSIYKIQEGEQLLVNVGSVGQPRDRDNRLSFCIYDTEKKIVELFRREYNISKAQEPMHKNGFADFLINRLNEGR